MPPAIRAYSGSGARVELECEPTNCNGRLQYLAIESDQNSIFKITDLVGSVWRQLSTDRGETIVFI